MWKLEDKARESLSANKIDYLKSQDNDASRKKAVDAVWTEFFHLRIIVN